MAEPLHTNAYHLHFLFRCYIHSTAHIDFFFLKRKQRINKEIFFSTLYSLSSLRALFHRSLTSVWKGKLCNKCTGLTYCSQLVSTLSKKVVSWGYPKVVTLVIHLWISKSSNLTLKKNPKGSYWYQDDDSHLGTKSSSFFLPTENTTQTILSKDLPT